MTTQGAWSAPIPASPRSRFADYEEAAKTVKFDPFFDGDWSYDKSKRIRQRSYKVKETEALTKADILESMLGL